MKLIKRLLKKGLEKPREVGAQLGRKELGWKVEKGTDLAIKEYREVFDKLAAYDRG